MSDVFDGPYSVIQAVDKICGWQSMTQTLSERLREGELKYDKLWSPANFPMQDTAT